MAGEPWHAEAEPYFHDNHGCPYGQAINPARRVPGTAGKPKCPECEELDRAEEELAE